MYNLKFCDEDAAEAVKIDVELYKEAGGGTIVENSSYGLYRNIPLMMQISQSTGVNVIAGTGMWLRNVSAFLIVRILNRNKIKDNHVYFVV